MVIVCAHVLSHRNDVRDIYKRTQQIFAGNEFFLVLLLMEQVVRIAESELAGEAQLFFSVDTSKEVRLMAENTLVHSSDLITENLTGNITDGELPNQLVATEQGQ